MSRISKLEFYNSPKSNQKVVFELDKKCQFFVLTGYNGAGKSRIIKIMQEAFCTIRDTKFDSNISRWAFDCTFSDGGKVRALKMEQGSATKEEVNQLFEDFFDKDLSLEKALENSIKIVSQEVSKTKYTKSSTSSEKREEFCGSGVKLPPKLLKITNPDLYAHNLSMIAYIDEAIHRNFPSKVMSSVIQGDQNNTTIDKTLASLIHEFVIKHAIADQVTGRISSLFTMKGGKLTSSLNKDKIRAAVEAAVEQFSNVTNFEDNEVFEVLNTFYGMTGRNLVWHNDSICLDVRNEGVIPFVDFSKGEKTLLNLMLTVYLNQDVSFFLLDEPDLSLHVEWQQKLLPAFQKLAPKAQFIIGTHSPFLVMHTQSEQVVNLAKIYKDQGI